MKRFVRKVMDFLVPEPPPSGKPTSTEVMQDYLDENRSTQLDPDEVDDQKVVVPVISIRF